MIYIDKLLTELKSGGHRVLIFSNFTTSLDFIEALCILRQHSYERLDGNCNRVERELAILRFNNHNSQCFVFLVTTTAGGVGITLTGADTVILFDAHYNPQLDRQAADRAHRIGQTRPVRVYRLCLQHTIEESIRMIA
uniref:Putative global transcription activator SNF2L1 n=1 Tax=Lygus hesperus TaxID=30085 RepID=A0A0A9WKK3_LYGHE